MAVTEAEATTSTEERRRRPVGVTIVVGIGLFQSLLLALAGIAMIALRGEAEAQADFEAGPAALVGAGALLIALAVLGSTLALLLARGSDRVRSLFGLVNAIEVAAAVYSLVALRDLRAESVWALVLPVAVLWFLYGSERTQEFFRR